MSSLLVSSFGLQPSACPYIKSHAFLELGAAVETQPFECGACHPNSSNHCEFMRDLAGEREHVTV